MSRVVVLGGGESGVGSAVLAKVKGFDVFLSDNGKIEDRYADELRKWDIPFEQGGHTEDLILNADEVIKSPGIPDTVPMVRKVTDKGIRIISEIEFAGRYDSAKKICITGSNGKTTTTSLIYYLLRNAGLNVGLGGNIGKSYALQVATEHFDYYVLEISSFQLDNCYDFHPDIAIIMNITPDHLDRYGFQFENYIRSKFRITRNLSKEDCFIFDSDDEITIAHLSKIVLTAKMLPFTQKKEVGQGAFLKEDRIMVRYNDEECDIYLKELALGGKHNIYNSMAAALAAKASGIDNKTIRECLATFKPIENRLEPVLSVKDVLYINDSKATNVDAAWYALECQKRPVVWIAGGKDKGNDYEVLKDLVRRKVKAIVCLGVDNTKLREAFEDIVGKDNMVETRSAEDAVAQASRFATAGDVVLLSPCCASFDLFRNMEERGEKFKEAVRNL
ncbi:MAG: UDP-N-acetylmuramoyl-L-alanine--D-glutamate ligase [Bacteroidales bacterium]|uniref:UDP-N-acetylmuramoyl-L-alanine--D-glutamate ligase n=1 Tax=Candidatus Cryptobacteroides sp. TaxID=2952915 RepID=UPI002A7246A4|nr:UDP-N-acetylmuramoyl-L-alanine--D-glutamate ligase [Candidatus Cryptobacteroides sp.]MDD5914543.1 UDP-N-acetylmuramoyl-L-alanine--D-glutamate ligase [Bacteroidales bacterium]MDD6829739.1 UDP-N-acetylmuramoyl-L-alanine--D-glutamate ligase [Bacteroidales bacterium]MDD7623765.1 UDP-N-acetylmuramoyl-L-alanine--D-glutamate ligase [Bacteroidales bacterium]MDY5042742.1 UDP-N-acetylmuramoyl-L-alanine--D-glutamate ligase [Candidatus Cryptobacteroides sp.]